MIVRGDARFLPLGDESVDLIVTSPPYFSLRSYRDGGEHLDGQVGDEDTPADFLIALWAVLDECWRVLKPSGSCWVNLGDKYAGSGGHNNAGLSTAGSTLEGTKQQERTGTRGISAKSTLRGNGHVGGVGKNGPNKIKQIPRSMPTTHRAEALTRARATRRNAPDRYNQAADVLPKSVMGLPWRFVLGASCPDPYRTVYDPGDHPQWLNRRPHIWHKPNGLPESARDRSHNNYEDWFHLTKRGDYFSAIDNIREPHDPHTLYCDEWERDQGGYERERLNPNRVDKGRPHSNPHPLGRIPGSVWKIATEPLKVPASIDVDHFAAFPTEWPRRLILGWCPPDGVVLDPFGGTGTTAMVARALGRVGISADLSADYCRLAAWRIFESRAAMKHRQGDLFTLVGDEHLHDEQALDDGPIRAGALVDPDPRTGRIERTGTGGFL